MKNPILVRTTVENDQDARKLADSLLTRRLVACAQITGPVDSIYWWQGAIVKSSEFILTVKTFDTAYPEVEKLLLAEHPYAVAEIVATPIGQISEAYLAWMNEEIRL
ncbi:MAG: divalent-cation tolerance protein CutA [Desulfopila sp.]